MKELTTTPATTPRASALPICGVAELITIGEMFERSGMFGCTQQGQGLVLAMTCVQTGMTPLDFQQTYHIVEGRPTMRSDAMLARLLEFGGSYEIVARDPERAAIKASYKDASMTFTLSWTEAQNEPYTKDRSGKVKHNWATARSRMQMLWARVVSDAVRTVCPIACRGSYTPEEVQDFDNSRAARDEAPTPKLVELDPAPARASAPAAPVLTPEVVDAPTDPKPDSQPVDFNVMPIGKFAGKAWGDFSDGQLQKALAIPNTAITDGHKKAIEAELERRQKAGAL